MAFISADGTTSGVDFQYSQPNLELITNSLGVKQKQFDRNYELLSKLKQGYLTLDLFNDEDKAKLNSYNTDIGTWFTDNRNADFSNSRTIEDVTKRFDVFSNDGELEAGVSKTREFRSILADIEESRKKGGNFSDISMQNVYDNLSEYKGLKGKDKLTHTPKQYVPHCDYTKSWFENTAKLVANVDYKPLVSGSDNYGTSILEINKNLLKERIYNGLYPSANDDCTQSQIREEALYRYNRDSKFKTNAYDEHQSMLKAHYQNSDQTVKYLEKQITFYKSHGNADEQPIIDQLEQDLKSAQDLKTTYQSRIAQTPDQDASYRDNFNNRDRNAILSDATETMTHQKLDAFASGAAYQQKLPKFENNPGLAAILAAKAKAAAGGGKSVKSSTIGPVDPADLGSARETTPISGIETYHTYNTEMEDARHNNLSTISDVITTLQSNESRFGATDPKLIEANKKWQDLQNHPENYTAEGKEQVLDEYREATRETIDKYYKDYKEGKVKDPMLKDALEKAFETADYEQTLMTKKDRVIKEILNMPEFKGKGYTSIDQILVNGKLKNIEDFVDNDKFMEAAGLNKADFMEIVPSTKEGFPREVFDRTKFLTYLSENKEQTIKNILAYNKKYQDGDTKKLIHYFDNPDVATFYDKADDKLKTLALNHLIFTMPTPKSKEEGLQWKMRAKNAMTSYYPNDVPAEYITILGFTRDNLHIQVNIPPKKKGGTDETYTILDPKGKKSTLKSGEHYPTVIKVPIDGANGNPLNGIIDLSKFGSGPIQKKAEILGPDDIQFFQHSKPFQNTVDGNNYQVSVRPMYEKGSTNFKYYYFINDKPIEDFYRSLEAMNPSIYKNMWEEYKAINPVDMSNYNNPDQVFNAIGETLVKLKKIKPIK